MTNLTAKQKKAVLKAEALLNQANQLLEANLRHLDHDILVAQLLSRVNKAASTSSIIESND
jgi:hypothetical protein